MFLVNVSPETFKRGSTGLVVGSIWLELDATLFPSNRWIDFPVVILGWWLQAIQAMSGGGKKRGECLFMDGPYWFVIEEIDPKSWIIQCFERRIRANEVLHSLMVDPAVVVQETRSAANSVIRTCHEKAWYSDDLVLLESHYALTTQGHQ